MNLKSAVKQDDFRKVTKSWNGEGLYSQENDRKRMHKTEREKCNFVQYKGVKTTGGNDGGRNARDDENGANLNNGN